MSDQPKERNQATDSSIGAISGFLAEAGAVAFPSIAEQSDESGSVASQDEDQNIEADGLAMQNQPQQSQQPQPQPQPGAGTAISGVQLNLVLVFNGEPTEDVENWIMAFEGLREAFTWDGAKAARIAEAKLCGKAAKWL